MYSGRRAFLTLSMGGLLAACAGRGEDVFVPPSEASFTDALAQVLNGGRRGTAFALARNPNRLLTAQHVVEEADDVRLLLSDGRVLPAQVTRRYTDRDLAELETQVPLPAGLSTRRQVGGEALVVGYDSMGTLRNLSTALQGPLDPGDDLAQDAPQALVGDGFVWDGMSGGPLLDSRARVIGMTLGRLEGASTDQRFLALPASLF